jgi:hypothetical protein
MDVSDHDQALDAALARCEAAFRALGDACAAACDVVLASREPQLAAQLMDCWYVAGATSRLLARQRDHERKTLAMMIAVARTVTRAAAMVAPAEPEPAVRAWTRAIREGSLAATAALSLIWDQALEPAASASPPRVRVTQELDPDDLTDDLLGAGELPLRKL